MGNGRTLQTSVVAAVGAVSRGGVVAAVIVVAIVGLVLRLLLCLLVGLLPSLFLSLLGGICLLLGLHRGGDVGLGLLQFRNRIIDVGFGRTGPVHHRIGLGDGVLQRGVALIHGGAVLLFHPVAGQDGEALVGGHK